MSKYIKITFGNGYCGCDGEEVIAYPDDIADKYIDMDAYSFALDNAEIYTHVVFDFNEDYTEEEYQDYIEGITYDWYEITEEEYYNIRRNNI